MRWPIPMRSQHGTSVVSRVGTQGGHPGTRRANARIRVRVHFTLASSGCTNHGGSADGHRLSMPMHHAHAPCTTRHAPGATRHAQCGGHRPRSHARLRNRAGARAVAVGAPGVGAPGVSIVAQRARAS